MTMPKINSGHYSRYGNSSNVGSSNNLGSLANNPNAQNGDNMWRRRSWWVSKKKQMLCLQNREKVCTHHKECVLTLFMMSCCWTPTTIYLPHFNQTKILWKQPALSILSVSHSSCSLLTPFYYRHHLLASDWPQSGNPLLPLLHPCAHWPFCIGASMLGQRRYQLVPQQQKFKNDQDKITEQGGQVSDVLERLGGVTGKHDEPLVHPAHHDPRFKGKDIRRWWWEFQLERLASEEISGWDTRTDF